MHEIRVDWNPAAGAMRFDACAENGYTIVMDTLPENGGDGAGMTPKMLLLVALGGCTGMDVIAILRKMRQDVTGYHLEITGWQRSEHPTRYEKIRVVHVVEGYRLNPELVEKAVRLSHEKYCSVGASLAGTVEITMESRVVERALEPVGAAINA